jgi:predicted ester cyclase
VSEPKEIVRRLEEAWASWDHDAVRDLLSPDLAEHTEHTGGGRGIDAAVQANEAVRMAFPDCERTVEDLFGQDDKVVARVRMRGTNEGGLPWFGVPPNGAKVDVEWISEYRVADGKIVEHWAQMDIPKLMTQLGATPAPGGGQ